MSTLQIRIANVSFVVFCRVKLWHRMEGVCVSYDVVFRNSKWPNVM